MLRTDDLLRIFHGHRGDAIVVPGRGGRHWGKISARPGRDLPMGDPASSRRPMTVMSLVTEKLRRWPSALNITMTKRIAASGF